MDYYLEIPSQLSFINEVKNFAERVFAESGLDSRNFNRIFLGLNEIVQNSIVHGNQLDYSKNVKIEISTSCDNVLIVVSDEGNGFSLESLRDPTNPENIKKENGRGIFLVKKLADQVLILEGGRKISVSYNLKR